MNNSLRASIIDIFRERKAQFAPDTPDRAGPSILLPNIKAVLFDIYGTLFISGSGDIGISGEKARPDLFLQALTEQGCNPTSSNAGTTAMNAFFSEIDKAHAVARKNGVEVPEVDIRDIWLSILGSLDSDGSISCEASPNLALMVAVAYESLANPTCPMPHLMRTLDRFSVEAWTMGIVSNAQIFTPLLFDAYLGKSVAELGFSEDLCAYSYLEGVAKPSAEIFQGVIENLRTSYGVQPRDVLYVGNDMLNDIWTANRIGCRTCLFAGDSRSLRLRQADHRCRNLIPDCVISSLPEIFEIFRSDTI